MTALLLQLSFRVLAVAPQERSAGVRRRLRTCTALRHVHWCSSGLHGCARDPSCRSSFAASGHAWEALDRLYEFEELPSW